jgi:hypothetical protein
MSLTSSRMNSRSFCTRCGDAMADNLPLPTTISAGGEILA